MVRLTLVALILLVALASADDAKPDPARSPALPAPEGLSIITLASKDRRVAGLRGPEGVAVDVVADAPAVSDPVALAFRDDGAPVVLDRIKGQGRVVALSSSKGDGTFDKSQVLMKAEASGLLLHDGWLYLATPDGVVRHRPSKDGGGYDKAEVVLKGLGGRGALGLSVGPEGWLYITCGDGDHFAEGSDRGRATLLRTGGVLRCRPDGSRLHVFALGLREPAGAVAFDLTGNGFVTDNGTPGNGPFAGTRLLHVAEGADFGWRRAAGGGRDPVRAVADRAGVMRPLLRTGRGAASGVLIYNDTRLPEELRGLLLCPDPRGGLVRAYRVIADEATFRPTEEVELLGAPAGRGLSPSHLTLGPDGAIYVASRSVGGQSGRVYRLSWSGTKDQPALPRRGLDSWAKVAGLKDAELIAALSSEDASDRGRAVHELARRGDRNRAALLKRAKGAETGALAQAAALAALASMYDDDVRAALLGALDDDAEVAGHAANLLGLSAKRGDRAVQEGLLKALSVEDLSARRAVALAMGRVAGPGAADSLATALSFDNGKDAYLRDGYLRALEMLGKGGVAALVALADSGVQKDTDKVVGSFAALRGRAAFDALPAVLGSPHVSDEQAAGLIRAAVRYQLSPPASLEGVVGHVAKLKTVSPSVSQALLDVLGAPDTAKGEKAAAWARPLLKSEDDATRRKAAFASLGTAEGAAEVARRVADQSVPRAVFPQAVAALYRHAREDGVAAAALLRLGGAMSASLDAGERALVSEAFWLVGQATRPGGK